MVYLIDKSVKRQRESNRSSAKREKGEFDGVQFVKRASVTTSKTMRKKVLGKAAEAAFWDRPKDRQL